MRVVVQSSISLRNPKRKRRVSQLLAEASLSYSGWGGGRKGGEVGLHFLPATMTPRASLCPLGVVFRSSCIADFKRRRIHPSCWESVRACARCCRERKKESERGGRKSSKHRERECVCVYVCMYACMFAYTASSLLGDGAFIREIPPSPPSFFPSAKRTRLYSPSCREGSAFPQAVMCACV